MAVDTTVKIFDQFYNLNLVVNADQYEIVYSFFKEYTSSIATAQSFTTTLFLIANQTQSNVLELLQTFEGSDKLKVSLTMAYYLNSVSNKTVMFGVNNILVPNNTVQRNILQ
jgi:hypothetical protein|tara:strand:+ start:37 stop:372 length:336 start_codon:yes stop_codon:yes gene_type:complete